MGTSALVGAGLTVAVAVSTLTVATAGGAATSAGGPEAEPPPNVVFIVMDDLRRDDMAWLPTVQREIGSTGTRFTNFYAPTPLCCPSRASTLRGQYPHNTGVLTNAEPDGGFAGFAALEDSTLATWLDPTYATGYVGKYLNGYESRTQEHVPPGWDDWNGSVRTYDYLGIRTNDNGTVVDEGGVNSPDVFARQAQEFFVERAPLTKPFFLHLSFVTPHSGGPAMDGYDVRGSPYVPPEDRDTYVGPDHSDSPAYDEADVSDKTGPVAQRPALTPDIEALLATRTKLRRESLASADRAIGRVLVDLDATGERNNTVIIFTSDNGLMLGEHRIPNGKSLPYEDAANLPFLISGPGVPAGNVWTGPAGTIDIAPTILDVADVDAAADVVLDGRSVLPSRARPDADAGRAILLEEAALPVDPEDGGAIRYAARRSVEDTEWAYRGIVTRHWKLVSWDGQDGYEMYDRRADPHELSNLSGQRRWAQREEALRDRLRRLWMCAGEACS